jgi:hypothetical protein
MRNAPNTVTQQVTRASDGDPRFLTFFWNGFQDAINRKPFRKSYDSMNKIDQLNYENGRLTGAAVGVIASGRSVWPVPKDDRLAMQLWHQYQRVYGGGVFPKGKAPNVV